MLAAEVDVGMSLLRDYVDATIGLRELGGMTHKSPKSLMRMLGPHCNPQARKPVSRSSAACRSARVCVWRSG